VSVPQVLVASTGTANTASVLAAFMRLGCEVRTTQAPEEVRDAEFVVLPGVGALAAAMQQLEARELSGALRERVAAGRPTLAICLGMQLLGEASDESPGAPALGLAAFRSVQLDGDVRVPHLGWNRVEPDAGCALLEPGYAYFAHSFCVREVEGDVVAARTDYGAPFVCAFERGALLACQFHPELSGAYGRDLLARWLAKGGASC